MQDLQCKQRKPILSTDSLTWFEMMEDWEKIGKEGGSVTC